MSVALSLTFRLWYPAYLSGIVAALAGVMYSVMKGFSLGQHIEAVHKECCLYLR